MLSLSEREAHIWLVNPEELTDPALLERYYPLMNDAESAQQQRFYRERDRHRYLVTRALARTTLSRYMSRDPEAWKFVFNEYQRPEIAPEQQEFPLRFNLSHTRGLIACLVNVRHDAGVDVEDLTRTTGVMNIAHFSFAPGEAQTLQACNDEARQRLFFTYWTLKEAYIKARGMGLSIPLDRFSFHRSTATELCLDFQPDFDDQHPHWQLEVYEPTPNHLLSVAIRTPDEAPLRLRLFWTTPLQEHRELALTPRALRTNP